LTVRRDGEGRLAVDEVEAVEVHDLGPRLGEVLHFSLPWDEPTSPGPRTRDSGSNRDAARGGLERRPSNSGGKAQKIAVRVSERELPKPDLAVISTIPALLDWHLWNESCSENPLMERRRVRHRDLEVHAPTVRIFERCKAKAPARTRRFFQHQVRIVEGEVGESLLFARIQDRKAYEADVKL
jgi:hypothetical protein